MTAFETSNNVDGCRTRDETPAAPAERSVPYSEWRLYRRTVEGTWRAFGLSKELLMYGVRRPVVTALSRWMMPLDNLFYPGLRRVEVSQPVFIIGHPRSGTTFLHRLLTQTDEFCVFQFWEIMFPALVYRNLVRGLIRHMVARGRGTFFPAKVGHVSALDQVEEEEILFFQTGNTQFTSCITPMAFSNEDFDDLVYADEQPPAVRRSAMAFLKRCFQRQIYATKRSRVVAKMNYSGMRVRSLLEAFPDAKIVYVVRSPLETIPSHLTLHRNMFDHMWGLKRIPVALLQRYYERRYQHNIAFYRYLEDLIDSGTLPQDRFLVVPYPRLRQNLAEVVKQVADFANLEMSPKLQGLIEKKSGEQRSYERPHKNSNLEEFGLTTERVLNDFAFVFDRYGFKRPDTPS